MDDNQVVMVSIHRSLIKEAKVASEQGGPPFSHEIIDARFSVEEKQAVYLGYMKMTKAKNALKEEVWKRKDGGSTSEVTMQGQILKMVIYTSIHDIPLTFFNVSLDASTVSRHWEVPSPLGHIQAP